MFGHQDDQNQHHHHDDDNKPMDDVLTEQAADSVLSTEHHGSTEVSDHDGDFNPALPTQDDNPFGVAAPSDTPTNDDSADTSAPVVTDEPVTAPSDDLVAPATGVDGDLLSIKQQALTELSPLVGHLEQTPEEKFRTTMMMIQASDNQALIKTAYEAAQSIPDEKVKA
ncbi:MAG TPA: hypothetical protein VGE30_01870, partial [Candidatus Saccharimonadales bacterium]